jgi:putative ABC transport system ATP-binding protein
MLDLSSVRLDLVSGAGKVEVLKGVDLAVPAGASVSVVGPSGSGKSSLLAVIAGIERPTAGTVVVDGQDLGTLDEDGLALFRRGRIAILFQAFHLIPTLTALENVATPLELAGEPNAMARARAALGEVGLAQRLGHYPAQLSGGEQQRVAMARALVVRPRLLLADEPTGSLDKTTGESVADLMFRLQREIGATLFLVTHEPSLAARCELRFAMDDGRITRLAPAEARVGEPVPA